MSAPDPTFSPSRIFRCVSFQKMAAVGSVAIIQLAISRRRSPRPASQPSVSSPRRTCSLVDCTQRADPIAAMSPHTAEQVRLVLLSPRFFVVSAQAVTRALPLDERARPYILAIADFSLRFVSENGRCRVGRHNPTWHFAASQSPPCISAFSFISKTDLFRGGLHATFRSDRRDVALHRRTGPARAVVPAFLRCLRPGCNASFASG